MTMTQPIGTEPGPFRVLDTSTLKARMIETFGRGKVLADVLRLSGTSVSLGDLVHAAASFSNDNNLPDEVTVNGGELMSTPLIVMLCMVGAEQHEQLVVEMTALAELAID